MNTEKITKVTLLLVSCILTTHVSIAAPVLFSENNLSGTSIKLLETNEYSDGSFSTLEDFIHFSPPNSYYAHSNTPNVNHLHGDNGILVNKSLYVPQCWRASLRMIPTYQLELNVGEYLFNVVNYFPFIQRVFYPGVYEFGNSTAEVQFNGPADLYIGYATQKDPSCVPSHDPLFVTNTRFEFFRCNGNNGEGVITWSRLQGDIKYTIQKKSGSNWYPLYSGSNSFLRYAGYSGIHSMRGRASAEGIDGPWQYFRVRVPSCPGTQPY